MFDRLQYLPAEPAHSFRATLKESRAKEARQESEKHRSYAQLAKESLFAKGRLPQPVIFRRYIIMVFLGPKDSTFDSEDMRFRKEATRRRCGTIRCLHFDGMILWALAYAPTVWAGGSMASDIFDCLVRDTESELVQSWPAMIKDTLHKLQEDDESLRSSPEYNQMLGGLICKPMVRRTILTSVKELAVRRDSMTNCADAKGRSFSKAKAQRLPHSMNHKRPSSCYRVVS